MKPIVLALVRADRRGQNAGFAGHSARVERGNSFNGFHAGLSRNGIGTAKSTLEERQNIAHYMIDIADPHACSRWQTIENRHFR